MPVAFTREDRVKLLAEVAEALLAGRLPAPAARLFVAGALDAWLRQGGRIGALERDFLKVAAPSRSTHTPARIWSRICSDVRATGDDVLGTVESGQLENDFDGNDDEL